MAKILRGTASQFYQATPGRWLAFFTHHFFSRTHTTLGAETLSLPTAPPPERSGSARMKASFTTPETKPPLTRRDAFCLPGKLRILHFTDIGAAIPDIFRRALHRAAERCGIHRTTHRVRRP